MPCFTAACQTASAVPSVERSSTTINSKSGDSSADAIVLAAYVGHEPADHGGLVPGSHDDAEGGHSLAPASAAAASAGAIGGRREAIATGTAQPRATPAVISGTAPPSRLWPDSRPDRDTRRPVRRAPRRATTCGVSELAVGLPGPARLAAAHQEPSPSSRARAVSESRPGRRGAPRWPTAGRPAGRGREAEIARRRRGGHRVDGRAAGRGRGPGASSSG